MRNFRKIPTLQLWACAALIGVFCGFIALLSISDSATSNAPSLDVKTRYLAKVISVSDGDSLTVETNDQIIKIRLAQIDAPERGQPWGRNSHRELARLVEGRTVSVLPQDTDRYGRTIADVTISGLNVNQAMIARGAAWAYLDYVRDPAIIDLEANARASGLGLWAMPEDQRLSPWEYRRRKRNNDGIITAR